MHLWRAVVSFPYRAVCSSALCVGGAPRLQGRLRCVAAAASDWLRSGGVGVGFDLHKRLDSESKSVSGGCRFVEAPHERIGYRELDADSPLVPDNARGRAAQQLEIEHRLRLLTVEELERDISIKRINTEFDGCPISLKLVNVGRAVLAFQWCNFQHIQKINGIPSKLSHRSFAATPTVILLEAGPTWGALEPLTAVRFRYAVTAASGQPGGIDRGAEGIVHAG